MALIHQKLYQGENLAAVNMKDYLETLSQSTLQTFGALAQRVQLHLPMEEIELDVDTAIPIGLITNELLTNSLKYAFPDHRTGTIEVSLTRQPDHQLRLQVADDGVGSTPKAAPQGTGFGTRLVQLLTLQLGGQLQQQTSPGTSTTVQFAVGA
jgi:two-component sensor histidine kinase